MSKVTVLLGVLAFFAMLGGTIPLNNAEPALSHYFEVQKWRLEMT